MGVATRPHESRWLGLTALTVLFGIQTLRALIPLSVFVLRDRFGWHAAAVGMATMAVLATGFLAAPVYRTIGPRRFLWLVVGGLGLARLMLQVWTGDPLVELGLAGIAALLFFWALWGLARGGGLSFVLGWLLGLAADTALHGAGGTWDLSWHADLAPLMAILVLVGLQWLLLASVAPRAESGANVPLAWFWMAFGPLLFLDLLVLGNVARLVALTGWEVEAAALWVLIGRILAYGAVALVASRGRLLGWRQSAILASTFLATLVVAWPRGMPAALLLIGGQVLAALLWVVIVCAAVQKDPRPRRLAVSHGVALLAFGILLFLYYGSIDIRLPFSKDALPPVAALAFGTVAVAAARSLSLRSAAGAVRGHFERYSWLALAVLLAPALIKLVALNVRAGEAAGFPLRIMTYNLHLGIDPRGNLGLEQIAATLEAERPDVVALQEVPRGWLIGGSVDVPAWLSRRLGMSYVFAGTAGPLWGNAVLSRRPILKVQALDLPSQDLLIQRGALSVHLDLGEDGPFEIIVTHHHHQRPGGAMRELQSQAILDFWRGRGRTAIVGDFNARPGEPEIEMLRRSGLGDVLDLAGVEPGYTNPASEPVQRIDYIWISPDLVASEVAVPSSLASDHLPVVATLDVRF